MEALGEGVLVQVFVSFYGGEEVGVGRVVVAKPALGAVVKDLTPRLGAPKHFVRVLATVVRAVGQFRHDASLKFVFYTE